MKIFNASQMREIDRKAIEAFGIPSTVLMERAGMQVAKAADEMLECVDDPKIVVVAGKGNNGGDAFVAARELVRRGEWVSVFCVHDERDFQGDAKHQLYILSKMGIQPVYSDPDRLSEELFDADLVIDGIFGTGFKGDPADAESQFIRVINDCDAEVLSIDIPSGVESNTGRAAKASVDAVTTVSLQYPKVGNVIGGGGVKNGLLRVADIGIPEEAADELSPEAILNELPLLPPYPTVEGELHKFKNGRALVIAGSPGLTGAAVMASASAMRAGCGFVVLGVPVGLNDVFESMTLEVMTVGLPETEERTLSADALDAILDMSARFDALALGPGISKHGETASLVKALLKSLDLPVILDADGINAIEGVSTILKERKAPTVVTPHIGEFSRLTAISIDEINSNRLKFVREIAADLGITVLLKGAKSIICSRDGVCFVNPTGNRGMATAGTGDVLTGITVALLAKGMYSAGAASLGAYLHGLSGDLARNEIGESGIVASDLIAMVPRAIEIYREERSRYEG